MDWTLTRCSATPTRWIRSTLRANRHNSIERNRSSSASSSGSPHTRFGDLTMHRTSWAVSLTVTMLALATLDGPHASAPGAQNWTHRVRIAGYGLGRRSAADIVRDAAASHVFGIEVDNDITGRYESFLDPGAKLAAVRALATETHTAGNRAFVYIA